MVSTKRSRSVNVLIVSAASFGNVGDDIVSLVSEAIIRDIVPNVETKFADLSFDHEELVWADVVVLGGGGVLYDSSIDNVDNYLRFIDHAKLMGKKTIGIGLGTQGINTDYGKRRYRETLSKIDLLIVRDREDAEVLSDIGVIGPIHAMTDLAFLMPKYLPEMQKYYRYHDSPDNASVANFRVGLKRLIGVSVALESDRVNVSNSYDKPKDYDKDSECEKQFILKLANDPKNKVVLVLQSEDDREFYESIQEKDSDIEMVTFPKHTGVLGLMDVYREFDAVVTSRYHGFITSLLTQKPVYVIDGANSRKIIRTINSYLPSLSDNIIKIDNISSTKINFDLPVDQAQIDETNTCIAKSYQIIDYLQSLLYNVGLK